MTSPTPGLARRDIPPATVARLPVYHRVLGQFDEAGVRTSPTWVRMAPEVWATTCASLPTKSRANLVSLSRGAWSLWAPAILARRWWPTEVSHRAASRSWASWTLTDHSWAPPSVSLMWWCSRWIGLSTSSLPPMRVSASSLFPRRLRKTSPTASLLLASAAF